MGPLVRANLVKQRLMAGLPVLTLRVLQSRTAEIIRIAKTSGHHGVLLDLQHSSMSLDTCCQLASAALDAGITPIVRVAADMAPTAAAALDGGAQALLLPGIETAEAAVAAIRALRYPPTGCRSVSAALPHSGYVKSPAVDLTRALDAETLILVQIESRRAVENAAAIAAVDGIDALVTGTNDLCAEGGLFLPHDHPEILEMHARLIDICRQEGIPLVAGGIGNRQIMARYLAMGSAPLFLTGSDLDFLIDGSRNAAAAFAELTPEAAI
ncbi:aldolase/citrate lyase family protein [Sphingomonas oligophenolica]|uniref:Aldolase/citrate lyase family protein n=1 Tax=Sphingomonas oligophenolica TaxID=301154 RepID=A0ABU9Y997_9SPHN